MGNNNGKKEDDLERKSPIHSSLLEALENLIDEGKKEDTLDTDISDVVDGLSEEDMTLVSVLGKSVKEVFQAPRDELEIDGSLIVRETTKEVDKEILDDYEEEPISLAFSLSKKEVIDELNAGKRRKQLLEFCSELHYLLTGYKLADGDVSSFIDELNSTPLDNYPEWTKSSLKNALDSFHFP